eukprot:724079-Rhodomonas_salina.1
MKLEEEGGFVTTIHAIASGLIKLSRFSSTQGIRTDVDQRATCAMMWRCRTPGPTVYVSATRCAVLSSRMAAGKVYRGIHGRNLPECFLRPVSPHPSPWTLDPKP